jgi:hypothetical protein
MREERWKREFLKKEAPHGQRAGVCCCGHGEEAGGGQCADQSQFHGKSPGARVARMQIVLLGMPSRYNFCVITT